MTAKVYHLLACNSSIENLSDMLLTDVQLSMAVSSFSWGYTKPYKKKAANEYGVEISVQKVLSNHVKGWHKSQPQEENRFDIFSKHTTRAHCKTGS